MPGFHVKRDDKVVVLAGTERGKRGSVMRVLTDKQRVVVQGLKMVKKHLRKSRENPQGKVVDREGSIHLSNVMRADLYDARQARRGVPPAGA